MGVVGRRRSHDATATKQHQWRAGPAIASVGGGGDAKPGPCPSTDPRRAGVAAHTSRLFFRPAPLTSPESQALVFGRAAAPSVLVARRAPATLCAPQARTHSVMADTVAESAASTVAAAAQPAAEATAVAAPDQAAQAAAVAAQPPADAAAAVAATEGAQGVKRERDEEDVGASESKRAAAGDDAPQVSRRQGARRAASPTAAGSGGGIVLDLLMACSVFLPVSSPPFPSPPIHMSTSSSPFRPLPRRRRHRDVFRACVPSASCESRHAIPSTRPSYIVCVGHPPPSGPRGPRCVRIPRCLCVATRRGSAVGGTGCRC